jgi:hypothetical protein
MFIGIMAKSIVNSLSSEFEALLSGNIANEILEKKVKEIISKNSPTNEKICPDCQTTNRASANFCDSCGRKL